MHSDASHHQVKMGSERGFGVVFAVVFAIIAAWPVIFDTGAPRWWAAAVALVFLLLGLFVPRVLAPLNRAWFKFGMLLGGIIAPLVMMLVFFVAVTPTGILMRLFGKDPLRLKKAQNGGSFWIERDPEEGRARSMGDQF